MFFGTVRLKVLNGKSWNSPITHKIFGCTSFFESLEVSPQIFWHCTTKTHDRIVIPLLSKNFWCQNRSETQKGSPTMFFGDLGQRNIDGKTWDPPLLIHKLFPYWNFSERQKRSPTKFFGAVRLKLFDWKSLDSSFVHSFFGCTIFLNHWRVLHKFFGTKRQKQSTESWYLFIQKLFDTRTFPKHKVPLRIFSVL